MELYGFMEREKKIPSYFFIITKKISLFSSRTSYKKNGYKNLSAYYF